MAGIKQYREMAPEWMEDETLKEIYGRCSGNHEQIIAAIQNLWEDTDRNRGSTEWINPTKNTKKVQPQSHENRGRGRSVPPGGRDGAGGGRGSSSRSVSASTNSGRGSGRNGNSRPSVSGSSASTTVKSKGSVQGDSASGTIYTDTAPASNVSKEGVQTPSLTTTVWGGETLAEKLKKKEEAAQAAAKILLAPPESVNQKVINPIENQSSGDMGVEGDLPAGGDVVKSSSRSRGGRSRGRGSGRRIEGEENEMPAVIADVTAEDVDNIQPVISNGTEELMPSVAEILLESETVLLDVIDTDSSINIIEEPQPPALLQHDEEPHDIISHQPTIAAELIPSEPIEGVQGSPKNFLKLGKWETPADSLSSGGAFQFGSFGSAFGADDAVAGTSTPWGVVSDTDSHTTLTSSVDSSVPVWTSQNTSVDVSAPVAAPGMSLFPTTQSSKNLAPVVDVSSSTAGATPNQSNRFDQQKSSAPPGLEIHGHPKSGNAASAIHQTGRNPAPGSQNRPKHDSQQVQAQHQPHHLQQAQQFAQYPQAPGIGNSRGAVSAVPAMAPFYPPFDPYIHQGYAPTPTPGASAATSGSTSAASSSAVGTQQQQQQGYATPPGITSPYYYPQPFYQQGYYYGQQMQNFSYPSGRYPPRPYGSDPYGNGYSPEYPPAQYGDSASSYGAMSMHPSSGIASGPSPIPAVSGSNTGASASTNKSKTGSGVPSAATQVPLAHVAQESPGNYYNSSAYGRAPEQWQPYQTPQWGMFPTQSPTATVGQPASGFAPQAGLPPQQQQQGQQAAPGSRDWNRTTGGGAYGNAGNNTFPNNRSGASGTGSTNWSPSS